MRKRLHLDENIWNFVLLAILTAVTACGRKLAVPPSSPEQIAPAPDVLLITANLDCDGLATSLRTAEEAGSIKRLFEDRYHLQVQTMHEPRQQALLDAISRPRRAPFFVYFGGHGILSPNDLYRGQSALCVSGRPLLVSKIISSLPKDAAFVFLLLNACYSAHVDIRIERPPVAVLSAHSSKLKIKSNGETVLGALLPTMLSTEADTNGDGFISDFEMLRCIERKAESTYPGKSFKPAPRLRTQANSELPALRVGQGDVVFRPEYHYARAVEIDERPPLTFVNVVGHLNPNLPANGPHKAWSHARVNGLSLCRKHRAVFHRF